MNYNELLEKYDDMVLYSTIMLPECIEEATIDIGNSIKIDIEREKIKNIIESKEIIGVNKVGFFFSPNDKRKFIFIDCNKKSDLYEIYVKCLKQESTEVNKIINKWFYITADEYGLPKEEDTIDWLHDKKYKFNPFENALKFNKLI